MTDTTLPAAGWYPNPSGAPERRWWDGQAWTAHIEQLPPPAPVQAAPVLPAPPVYIPPPLSANPVYPAAQTQPAYPAQQPTYPAQQPAYPAQQQRAPFGGGMYNAGYDAARGKNAAAVTSLILGIGSVVLLFPPVNRVTIFSALGAIVWGAIAIRRASWSGVGRKRAIWGLILGCLGFIFSVLALVNLVIPAAPQYDKAYVEKAIVDGVAKQSSGEKVTVQCPTDPPFRVGTTFQCVATTADGQTHFVDVKVQDDTGSFTWQTKG